MTSSTTAAVAISLGMLAAGPACCVSEGALVSTPLGPRPIERLRSGDAVWAVDPRTGQRVPARITAIRSATRECLALCVGGGALHCTPDHPIYCPSSSTYVPAVSFLHGKAREVLAVDDEGTRVAPVEAVRTDVGLRRVFDLTVESEHHSFVADGVLVHNKSYACDVTNDCEALDTFFEDTSSDSTTGAADGTTAGSTSGSSSSSSSGTGSSGGSSSADSSDTGSSDAGSSDTGSSDTGSSDTGSSGGTSTGGSSGTGSSSSG
jgi:hypothetical protein